MHRLRRDRIAQGGGAALLGAAAESRPFGPRTSLVLEGAGHRLGARDEGAEVRAVIFAPDHPVTNAHVSRSYSAASAMMNCSASVDWASAVVEACPPETVSATRSK